MEKIKNVLKKLQKGSLVTSLALIVVAVSEAAAFNCIVWILGQEDMPEELL